jgi:hypothetical protein
MGSRTCQLVATIYVASSQALFARGGADLAGGFCLQTLSYRRPTTIMGPALDMDVVSHDVVGMSCMELGWHVNMCLLCPFTTPIRVCRFVSSVLTPWGYKSGSRPRKRGREIDLKIGERVVELTWHCFSLPSKLWWSNVGSRQRSCRSINRTL